MVIKRMLVPHITQLWLSFNCPKILHLILISYFAIWIEGAQPTISKLIIKLKERENYDHKLWDW